jgi:hypothetical protein
MTLLTFPLQLNQHNIGAVAKNFFISVATTVVEIRNM